MRSGDVANAHPREVTGDVVWIPGRRLRLAGGRCGHWYGRRLRERRDLLGRHRRGQFRCGRALLGGPLGFRGTMAEEDCRDQCRDREDGKRRPLQETGIHGRRRREGVLGEGPPGAGFSRTGGSPASNKISRSSASRHVPHFQDSCGTAQSLGFAVSLAGSTFAIRTFFLGVSVGSPACRTPDSVSATRMRDTRRVCEAAFTLRTFPCFGFPNHYAMTWGPIGG